MRKAIAVLSFSFFAVQATMAAEITGYVSDAKCAASGAKAKTAAEWIKPAAFENCVKDCVNKEGSEAVFVTEDNKTLKFDVASLEKMKAHLGHKVRVTGNVVGNVLKVDSVSMLKLQ
jgi:hypothetical protein